jgi:hypothetical protein
MWMDAYEQLIIHVTNFNITKKNKQLHFGKEKSGQC